jgi:hypothetical protein
MMVLSTSTEVFGQVKPFKITGKGTIIEPIPFFPGGTAKHNIAGNATHLGRHEGAGEAEILTVDLNTGKGTFRSSSDVPFVFVAANGDKLAFHYGNNEETGAKDGRVTAIPISPTKFRTIWVAEFIPVPEQSTGRFKRVYDGCFTMIAETEPFTPLIPGSGLEPDEQIEYEWSGQGWIAFAKRGRK